MKPANSTDRTSAIERIALFHSLDEHWLHQALARVHGAKHGNAWVGLLLGERLFAASIDARGVVRDCGTEDRRGPVGCVVKLLTGTLAMRAAMERGMDFATPVRDFIADTSDDLAALLTGVTVRQLLNHTHGIDASDQECVGFTSGGRLDIRSLGHSHRARRLFAPGTLYSYGSAGAWVVAAALENLYCAPFAELLATQLVVPARVDLPGEEKHSKHWCPANGADLQLSVPELLRFCHWYLLQDDLRKNAELDLPARPPGWCLERGACAGWKYFGDGWYGHSMALPRDSLLVRVHMESRIAVVVAAEEIPASLITIRMFGRLLPEYLTMRLPKPLSGASTDGSAARYCGTYENRATAVRISFSAQTGMEAEILSNLDRQAPVIRARLYPGTDEAWLVESTDTAPFNWVQFVAANDVEPTHVWDGRQVFRRA